MSRKALLIILALLLVFAVSLSGCSQQVMSPSVVSNPKDQEVVEDKNENGVEEQGEIT